MDDACTVHTNAHVTNVHAFHHTQISTVVVRRKYPTISIWAMNYSGTTLSCAPQTPARIEHVLYQSFVVQEPTVLAVRARVQKDCTRLEIILPSQAKCYPM